MGPDHHTLGIVRRIELTIGVVLAIGFALCAVYTVGTIQHFADEIGYRTALMTRRPPASPSLPQQQSGDVHGAAYPAIALRNHQEGRVVLDIVIAEDGSVVDADVAESSGFPQLDAAALTAVGDWHYPPPVKDGKPVRDRRKVAIVFKAAG